MNQWVLAVCALTVAGAGSPAAALSKCIVGQPVSDPRGRSGAIVWDGGDFCRVRYEDGQTYGWMSAGLGAADIPAKSGSATSDGFAPSISPPTKDALPSQHADGVTILKPAASPLTYRADPQGYFLVTAALNGALVPCLIDTGATLVFLTPEDARAAGINWSKLTFDTVVQTGNGRARAASVLLREIRIERVAIDNVPAAVMENLDRSVLGMSFLKRLKGFEIREGALRINQ